MLLRPRKFKYKNLSKRRSFRFSIKTNLLFGHTGLLLLQPLRLNAKQMFRYKLFLKKAAKRSDKTLRRAWFNLFPHLPISRKVAGSRMGKGKGKLAGWSSEVPAGVFLFELKNLRRGRALYFCNQMSHRVSSLTRVYSLFSKQTHVTININKKISYNTIW